MKKIGIICIALLLIMGIIGCYQFYYSPYNTETKIVEERLADIAAYRIGNLADIFNIEYDTVYSIVGDKTKEEIQEEIGIKDRKLKDSKNSLMNILFVKENKIVMYLYGNPEQKGYYLPLPEGTYTKQQIEQITFKAQGKNDYLNYQLSNLPK